MSPFGVICCQVNLAAHNGRECAYTALTVTTKGGGTLGSRLRAWRQERGLEQKQLAREAKVSRPYLSQLENDRRERPGVEVLQRLAAALGVPLGHLTENDEDHPSTSGQSSDKAVTRQTDATVTEVITPPDEGEGSPIYDWAACGDPTAHEESERPIPIDTRRLDGGEARMIGKQGFGVRVRGESMSNWGIHHEYIVWVNPTIEPRKNWPVLARLLGPDGEDLGSVVKLLVEQNGECLLLSDGRDGNGPVPCENAVLIGPIMLIEAPRVVPRRRRPEDQAAEMVSYLRGGIPRRSAG